MTVIYVGMAIVAGMLCGAAWAWLSERKEWNGGVCSASGRPWRLADMDSHGGRLYVDDVGHHTWISWPVDHE